MPLDKVVLTAIADNRVVSPKLKAVWGLSICVSAKRSGRYISLLFDTDTYPHILKYNIRTLGLKLERIHGIVISHDHSDHTGGLSLIPNYAQGIPVYVPHKSSSTLKERILSLGFKLVEVKDKYMIDDGIFIIGGLERYGISEQSLVLSVSNLGLIVLVGCSHPGVVNIVRKAYKELRIKPYAVIGGFHLEWAPSEEIRRVVKELLSLGVRKIGPMHCSGEEIREYLRDHYPRVFLDMRAGSTIIFEV